jgi:hypothetical protein
MIYSMTIAMHYFSTGNGSTITHDRILGDRLSFNIYTGTATATAKFPANFSINLLSNWRYSPTHLLPGTRSFRSAIVLVGNPIRLVSVVESGDALPMRDVCRLIWLALVGLLQSRVSLEVEILALRHQLNVLRRKSPKKPTFTIIDRLVFAGLYRLAPGMLDALAIVEPQTVIRWHRAGFRAYWRWKSKPRGGRPKTPLEIRPSHSRHQPGQSTLGWLSGFTENSSADNKCAKNGRLSFCR